VVLALNEKVIAPHNVWMQQMCQQPRFLVGESKKDND
jgi:hypothetical protein